MLGIISFTPTYGLSGARGFIVRSLQRRVGRLNLREHQQTAAKGVISHYLRVAFCVQHIQQAEGSILRPIIGYEAVTQGEVHSLAEINRTRVPAS